MSLIGFWYSDRKNFTSRYVKVVLILPAFRKGDVLNSLAVVIVLLLLVVAGVTLFGKSHTRQEEKKPSATNSAASTLSPEEAKLYEEGLHPGEDGQALMYTLSVCRHCVSLKNWLIQHDIPFHEVYVDRYQGAERKALVEKLRSYNPRGSFPTLVLPGGEKSLVGFREAELKKVFEV